ncbi:hypothetical protein EYZ11_004829 [Aspergillus tanneri]|uniref:Uncharacterized protein n=1 Tax=Aspergillus tanneri TaxID=1220188 RepID=A0A4S3JLW3_9EURO|nr:hypothetical protein EYZ11_004829 [Aspergillus tanneri]
MANRTIRNNLINYSRNIICTTARSFLTLGAIKACYSLVPSKEGDKWRERLQKLNRSSRIGQLSVYGYSQ